eukprot:CAMPEP_0172455996 /NCGR_PEP_ID=MMETSP1065-20121228/13580_1 /TAXON_ID=265537 /ORGANISM="Amphiprora paludosa, Strain CCMP125" /LENGTH=108 /DNA_ID=CAMNT_0013208589 /DNA_START=64 /DNA_END=390 /DNA_ORIENTATION=+
MVRVFYEPPPYGPRTNLNKTSWGVRGGGLVGVKNLEILSKMNQSVVMTGFVAGALVIAVTAQLTIFRYDLPFSMEPQYQAAQRAYMRYHNMNPIFGISSKKNRATDPE